MGHYAGEMGYTAPDSGFDVGRVYYGYRFEKVNPSYSYNDFVKCPVCRGIFEAEDAEFHAQHAHADFWNEDIVSCSYVTMHKMNEPCPRCPWGEYPGDHF